MALKQQRFFFPFHHFSLQMEGWGLNKVMRFAQGATPMCKATQSRGTSGGTMVTVNATVLTTILLQFIG